MKKVELPDVRPPLPSQELTDVGASGMVFIPILMMLVAIVRAVAK